MELAAASTAPSLDDPVSFMRNQLRPVVQESLMDENNLIPVFYNVVSNAKLDPLLNGRPTVLPIQDMINRFQNAELKQGFGALIFRMMHTLSKDQERLQGLKESSVTHLCFSKGALGSTGNRSRDEALYSCHEFRMLLYMTYNIRTNLRRFTIPNMVCSSALGHCVNLAQMHAEDQVKTDYEPDLFPGLFFYYKYVFKKREGIHAQVKLSEDDLVQLHRHSSSSSRNESEDVIRSQVRGMLDSYLPKYKYVMVLVFIGGKLVGLGVDDQEIAEEAFKYVGSVAARYKITDREATELKKRRKAQYRLVDKDDFMEEVRINYIQPFSKEARRKIDKLSIEDEETRKARIREILIEERGKKKKPGDRARKRAKGAEENLIDEEALAMGDLNEFTDILEELLRDNGTLTEEGYGSDSSAGGNASPDSGASESGPMVCDAIAGADGAGEEVEGGGDIDRASQRPFGQDFSLMDSLLKTAEDGRSSWSLPDEIHSAFDG
jgi:TATA-box binding protein (TBP) (component of TFIID and TFIIIB)